MLICSIQLLPKTKKRNIYGVLYPITSYFSTLQGGNGGTSIKYINNNILIIFIIFIFTTLHQVQVKEIQSLRKFESS